MFIYFDESKFPKENFIFGSFVFCEDNPNDFIKEVLINHGFNPDIEEFKSNIHFGRNPKMIGVREDLKNYFHRNCRFGIIFLQHDELSNLGFIALDALAQFLEKNGFENKNQIYFDEGIFKSRNKAIEHIKHLRLENNTFHLEQDSRKIKGIQLSDLCSHCLTTMLREALGDLNKMVKVPKNSGYDPDDESEIGFDIWATIRCAFLREPNKIFIETENMESNFTYQVEPYGLFISEHCQDNLAEKVRETFGTVYLGCIH